MSWSELRADLVILACAVSAGVHAALVPEHLRERVATGAGFIAATILLAVLGVALTYRPDNESALVAAVVVFAGLLVSYALAVTTGVPVLQPEAEPVDALALFTKGVEAVGLAVALTAIRPSFAERPLDRTEGVRA